MENVSDKIFLCYAWEDMAAVKRAVSELEEDLDARISSDTEFTENKFEANEDVLRKVEDSKLFLVFLSNVSKNVDYVKQCVVHAQNVNKGIIPVEIGKCGALPEEFRFRITPYNYSSQEDRGKLEGQIRATLGFNVVNGDDYGSLIHIQTDMKAHVMRNGENLLKDLAPGKEGQIRLKKGTHQLQFVAADNFKVQHVEKYEVKTNDGEQFLSVSLIDIYNKVLQQAEIDRIKMEKDLDCQRKAAASNKKGRSVGKIFLWIFLVFLALAVVLFAVVECSEESYDDYEAPDVLLYEEVPIKSVEERESEYISSEPVSPIGYDEGEILGYDEDDAVVYGEEFDDEFNEELEDYDAIRAEHEANIRMQEEYENEYEEMVKESEREYEEMVRESEREYQKMLEESEREYEEMMQDAEQRNNEIMKKAGERQKEMMKKAGDRQKEMMKRQQEMMDDFGW